MNTTLHQNRPEDTQNWTNLYLEPHDYRIHYVNIDLRHQYGIYVAESQTFLLAKRPQRWRARRNGCFCRLGSDMSSVWNFCVCFSDIILRGLVVASQNVGWFLRLWFTLRMDFTDNIIIHVCMRCMLYNYMVSKNNTVEPPFVTTSRKRSPPITDKLPPNQNTKIFPVKDLKLEPLVNDHLL